MSDAIERLKIGQRREVTRILEPGVYNLYHNGEFIRLKHKASIVKFQKFTRFGEWTDDGYDLDTLKVIPTRWERLKAWLARKSAIPRAIVLTGSVSDLSRRA